MDDRRDRDEQHKVEHRRGLSRRTAIRLAHGAATATLIGGFAHRSAAQSAPHQFKLGDAEVTVLSDGTMTLPLSFALPATEPSVAAALLQAASIKADVNVVVVKTPGALVVIDCGSTPDFMPSLGAFPERLERAGFKAEDVTHVIFTHAHADHLWGVIDPLDDDTRFTKARHLMTAAERDFWLRAGLVDTVPDALKGTTIGTARRLKLLEKRIEAVKPEAEIIPGVALVATPGHTPGHVSVQLSFGGASLIVGGDAIGNAAVSFQQPDWVWGPDLDRDLGAATRRKLLDRLAADRSLLLGYHLPWPGVGRVERKDQAYRYVAA
jgi:glyoxylase-like metal-dependent hydrolase (beta-lactamase superfamily II)